VKVDVPQTRPGAECSCRSETRERFQTRERVRPIITCSRSPQRPDLYRMRL